MFDDNRSAFMYATRFVPDNYVHNYKLRNTTTCCKDRFRDREDRGTDRGHNWVPFAAVGPLCVSTPDRFLRKYKRNTLVNIVCGSLVLILLFGKLVKGRSNSTQCRCMFTSL